jgi:hypothetical protein
MNRRANMNTKAGHSNSQGHSRRHFLKATAAFTLGSIAVGSRSLAAVLDAGGDIALVVTPEDTLANAIGPTWALGELEIAMKKQGAKVRRTRRLADAGDNEFRVLAAGMASPPANDILKRKSLAAPTEAESLCLVQGEAEGRPVLLAGGADERGQVYALTELADRVACLQAGRSALEFGEPVIERPASRTRSVIRGFSSEVEDKSWFYDRDYWREYLTMLVYSRVNRVNFTTGMGYNSVQNVTDGYFVFPYPFLVNVPGYGVRARGLADEERARNLETLKFVGEECARRGLRFQIAIWTLAYKWLRSPQATYPIEGLTDATHAPYCRDALALLLKEVPQIGGVTFRVHDESGIAKGEEDFWHTQFAAIKDCGRCVEIDMHFKNMTPATLQTALATDQPVVLGPKYCGEHLGLPYHQASIRERERSPAGSLKDTGTGVLIGNRKFTRYGYGDVFAENRNWDVVFRIWPGTQRFLLNGDPATFAGYGRAASFCGAAGIELSEPLHFKGRRGSGLAGGRLAYADASLNPRYDFEKYRYTYRLWGRLGYNPGAKPEVWRRALQKEFGDAALAVEQALGPASRVLTLFTQAHGPSADCGSYWPELYLNMAITDKDLLVPYRDTRPPPLFGNVSPFDPQLFQSPDECGDTLVSGQVTGKYSPLEVAQWLEDLAAATGQNINLARLQLGPQASKPGFRRIEEDVLIQKGLAELFAGKLRCSVLWRVFTLTGDRAAGEAAVASYVRGRDAWAAMAERAKTVYRSDITYGSNRNLRGHWIDRIPDFDKDIADLRQRLQTPLVPAATVDAAAGARALKIATGKPARPLVAASHAPVERFQAGKPLAISINPTVPTPRRVTLHYRHVNQAEHWQSLELKREGGDFRGEIPAAYTNHRFPLQYYFEIEVGAAGAAMHPPLASDLANFPYFTATSSL